MKTVRLIVGILLILIGSFALLGIATELLEGTSESSVATDMMTLVVLGSAIVGGFFLCRRALLKGGDTQTAPEVISEFQARKYFRKTMLPAILIAVAWNVFFILYHQFLDSNPYSLSNVLVSSVLMFAYAPFVIYALHRMANGKIVNGGPRYFGIWGFTWRVLIVEYSALLVFALVLFVVIWTLFDKDSSLIEPSVTFSIVSMAAITVISPAMIWLFFSKDRRSQLHWFLRLFAIG